jgi:uncharacterized repeat protein (TIGR01451 family)
MKIASNNTGLFFRLGVLATAMLFGQQAMAEGTRAGTSIANTATVDYVVNGVDQDEITSDPATATFVVDRRISFTLTPDASDDLVTVTPGGAGYFVDFTLVNGSNDILDFTLVVAEVAPSDGSIDVDGQGGDTADMGTLDYAVVTGTDGTPTRGGEQYVDDLAADDSVRIRVFGDAALTLLNGQIAGAELRATAVDSSGTSGSPGAVFDYNVADTAAGVETVDFADADGVQVAIDGFLVQSADVSITKDYEVIDDGLDGTLAIPGALVEYVVTVGNASTTTGATGVVVTDTLASELEFEVDGMGGTDDMTYEVNGGGATGCSEGADGDICERSGQDLTFTIGTLNASETYVFTWRVRIADPLATPPAP